MWRLYAAAAAGVALMAFLGWTAIKVFPAYLVDAGKEIQQLKRDLALANSKIAAADLGKQRRDAAIKASPCKTQIEFWIKNPDNLPGTWNPHEQLTAPNIRDNAKPGTLPSIPWSSLNPFNWF